MPVKCMLTWMPCQITIEKQNKNLKASLARSLENGEVKYHGWINK